MKIGFDGKRAANNFTGLGNYSRTLITQLATRFPENQYFVYTEKLSQKPQITSFFEQSSIFLKLRLASSKKILWRSFGIKKQLKEDDIDLFHGLSYEIPIGLNKQSVKSVVTIHDLIYLRFPQYYNLIDRLIYDWKSKYACLHANRIVAISEQTKSDIIEYYSIEPDKIDVIYQSCDDSFKISLSEEVRNKVLDKHSLPNKFLLNVGTIEPRKNLLLVINALKDVSENYKLVVIGKKQPYSLLVNKRIKELNLVHRVIFLEGLTFTDLPSIYQSATAFIYPSFYEGFGIPVIEALYSQTPVIAATGSCLEEAGGPDSIYINPDDHQALASQINRVISSPDLRAKMRKAGYSYVQKFDSHLLAQQMMQCYQNTLNLKHSDA
jgi:glycosyltransferase involved in cell wall biosynthesis